MNIYEENNTVVIDGLSDFLPEHTFLCGQCFRWDREQDKSFTGVAYGKVVNIRTEGDTAYIKGATLSDFESIWRAYLDIDRDYSKIKDGLRCGGAIDLAVDYGWGIRVLKQELFETLLTFIISQRSSIPRIKTCVERMCNAWGDPILFEGKTYYSFPRPEALFDKTEEDFAALGVGYRARYLYNAVQAIAVGAFDMESIKHMLYGQAREALLSLNGVGQKVADCILLFGLGHLSSFPVDVWISRAMKDHYDCSEKDAGKMGADTFGEYAGIAQQYLFYWKKMCG